jgi:hypothetical protein
MLNTDLSGLPLAGEEPGGDVILGEGEEAEGADPRTESYLLPERRRGGAG